MPFLYTPTKTDKNIGKEHDSFITSTYNSQNRNTLKNSPVERVSRFASRGSVTVEASIAVSLFFFAMLTLSSILELIYIQTNMRNALCSVGKQMAVESYLQPLIFTEQLEQRIEEFLDEGWLEVKGIDCSRSRRYLTTTIMELVVDYQIEFPILIFRVPILTQSESIRIKGWTGKDGLGLGSGDEEIVYMTEHGVVYHEDIHCTHLELTIRPIGSSEIESYRNASGDKYRACETCGKMILSQKTVYITEQGNRYHSSLDCKGLKRTVYAVAKKDIYGIGGCSKCVN